MRTSTLLVLLVVALLAPKSTYAAPRVYLELITGKGFPLTGQQEWSRRLADVGADSVRLRAGRGGERPKIENTGSERAPSFRVTGVFDTNEVLHLPGARFSARDTARIRAWIENLKSGGGSSPSDQPGAFGLTNKQLLELHAKLSAKMTSPTKGKSSAQIVADISRGLPIQVGIDGSAKAALASGETVGDELLGVSRGTALAAVLRPLGLVVVPQRRGTTTQMVIVDSRRSEQSWPIGWPSEQKPQDVMPELYKFIPVEINDFALTDALAALQERLKVPFLYDHNSMARHGIEPTDAVVSHPKGKTYYKKVIDRLLAQAKLKAELRVDEAGQPLLWITTIKK